MISAQEFADAVDGLTGQVAISLPLISMPGPETLPVSLGLTYNSAVANTVQHWNLTNPTGVVGLGWDLPRSAIIATRPNGADLGDCGLQVTLNGVTSTLIPTGTLSGDDQQWQAVTQPFWLITFDSDANRWTLVDENGVTFVFGGFDNGAGATEYAVTTGDWVASTNQTSPQSLVATAWDLASITDLFGNQCRLHYNLVTSNLTANGLPYTMASYLARIEGAWGDVIKLSYVEKQTYEYALPYTSPDPPNAYQVRMETRALDTITMLPADGGGTATITLRFAYQTNFNAVDSANSAFNKRTLTSVTQSYLSGNTLPPLIFSYIAKTGVNPGALSTVTTLEGAVVTYTYDRPSAALQYSDRAATLSRSATTDSLTDLIFQESFVTALWSKVGGSAVIAPYRWEGRWLAGTTTSIASAASLTTTSSADLFGVMAGSQLYSFYRDPSLPAGWIAGSVDLSVTAPSGTTGYRVAAGDRFIAALCLPSGKILRVDFASLAWQTPVLIDPGISGSAFALAAQGNKLLLAAASSSNVQMWLDTRSATGQWTTDSRAVSASLAGSTSLTTVFCQAGAAIVATNVSGTDTRYRAYAAAFKATGTIGDLFLLGSGPGSPALSATGMTVQVGSLVSRFNGAVWVTADLADLEMPAGGTLAGYAAGQDMAARTVTVSSASQFQIVEFDANAGSWSVKATATAPATGTGVAVAPRGQPGPTRYAALSGSLYYMGSNLSWSATSAALPSLTAADASSLQVLSDNYLIYQDTAGSKVNVWFLGNGGCTATASVSTATIIAAGKPAGFLVGSSAFVTCQGTFNGSDMTLTLRRPVTGAVSGQQSAIIVKSVTVSSGYESQATVVTIPGAQTQANVQLLGGNQTNYSFTATGATISADGLTPLFNETKVMPNAPAGTTASVGQMWTYRFNGLSASESQVSAAPSDTTVENSTSVPSILVGFVYSTLAKDAQSNTTSSQAFYYWGWVTGKPMGFTIWARPKRNVSVLDNVTSSVDTAYDTQNGMPNVNSTSYVDGAGATVKTTCTMTYFYQVYSAGTAINLLSPVVSTTTTAVKTTGGTAGPVTTTGATATTWQESWPDGVTGWGPAGNFQQTSSNASAFNAWIPGSTVTSGWQSTGAVTARSQTGLAIAGQDINQVTFYALCDLQERFICASAANADQQSLSYYGCEPYEQTSGWSTVSGRSLTAYLTTSDAHTGSTSLELSANTASGLFVNYYQPTDISQQYVFGCWARSPVGFDSGGGTAVARARFTALWTVGGTAHQADISTLTLSSSSNSDWLYAQILLSFSTALGGTTPDAGSFSCRVRLENANATSSILLDELRLTPVVGSFSATVMDTTYWLQRAAIGNNGQSVQTIYDGWLQPVATLGPDNSVLGANVTGWSRQLPGTNGSFNQWWPNSSVAITPGGATQYDDFHSDTTANWNFSNTGGTWSVGNGVLGFTGTATGTAVIGGTASPKTANTANFAARILVDKSSGASPALGDGTIFMRWDTTANANAGGFTLVTADSNGAVKTVLQNAGGTVTYGSDWLFIAVDGFYYCSVNGLPLFSYIRKQGAPATAGLVIASNGSTNFDELIRLDDPGVGFSYSDAMGRPTQQFKLIGGSGSITDNQISIQVINDLRDSFGRQVISGQPQTATLSVVTSSGPPPTESVADDAEGAADTSPTLVDGSPSEYLVTGESGGTAIDSFVEEGVAVNGQTANALCYNTMILSDCPLCRPASALEARSATNANGSGFERTWTYSGVSSLLSTTTTAPSPTTTAASATTVPAYRQAVLSLQTGSTGGTVSAIQTGQIRASDGRLLQGFQGTASKPTQLSWKWTYTLAGQVETRTQANAAAPPDGRSATIWTEQFAYDFLGNVTAWNSPDRGATQYAYDSAGQLRFYMDAEGAAQTPERINYLSYDILGRVVEQGWINSASYGWGSPALTAELNNQAFPNVSGGQGSGTTVSGRWRRQFSYDTDGNPQTHNLLGRLWKVKSQPDSGIDATSTTYTYDDFGQVISNLESVTQGTGTSTATTAYSYNAAGQIASITYPALDAAGFSVGFYYDRLGRPAGVGDVSSNNALVDPSKLVPQIQVRYAGYQYGQFGQLSKITLNQPATATSPAFSRTLSYSNRAQLSAISDPYLILTMGYSDASYTSSTARVISVLATYQVSSQWTTPPTPYGFAYRYDDLGRLTAATPSQPENAAFGFQATGTTPYDANGNRLAWGRGVTGYSGQYPTATTVVPANGMTSFIPAVSSSQSFTAAGSTTGPWHWGSNNGGPSNSTLTGSTGAEYLKLGGGNGIGHFEQLVLDTWLEPTATLQLIATMGTDADYPATGGNRAAWMLTLYGPSGPVTEKLLQYVSQGSGAGSWADQTIPIDMPTIIAGSGYPGTITRAQLSLQNMTRAAYDGTSGAAIYINLLRLSWTSPPTWAFSYDKIGGVSCEQPTLSTISYDFLSGQATAVAATNAGQTWLRNSAGQPVTSVVTASGTTVTTRNHFDLNGNLIAQSQSDGTTNTAAYFVNGPGGLVAVQQDDDLMFVLRDHVGSVRVLVDGTTNKAIASFDYQPFGAIARTTGDDPVLARFAGHPILSAGSQITTPARLLDPVTGRFQQVDPDYDGLSPYGYVQNDPVNLVDSSGAVWQTVVAGAVLSGIDNAWQNYKSENTIGQNLGYFAVGTVTGLASTGVSIGYVGPFSIAAGTRFILAGALHSATSGAGSALFRNYFNRQVSGNWEGYDSSLGGLWQQFSDGATVNLGTALISGSIGVAVGARWHQSADPRAIRWYDPNLLGRAFYDPGADYSKYSNRLTKILGEYNLLWKIPQGTRMRRGFDLEHTVPQRWLKILGKPYAQIGHSPIMLLPTPLWFNQKLLEAKDPVSSAIAGLSGIGQKRLADIYRAIYAPTVILAMGAGAAGAAAGSARTITGLLAGPAAPPNQVNTCGNPA